MPTEPADATKVKTTQQALKTERASKGDVKGKRLVVASYVFMVFCNAVGFSGVFNSGSSVNMRVATDGLTMAVWTVIYFLQLVLIAAQCFAAPDIENLLQQGLRTRIAAAFCLNGLWLPICSAQMFLCAAIIVLAYLCVLISILWTVVIAYRNQVVTLHQKQERAFIKEQTIVNNWDAP